MLLAHILIPMTNERKSLVLCDKFEYLWRRENVLDKKLTTRVT